MSDLLQWWNLVYVLAFFFALLYAALNALGLGGSDAEIDADADLDADLDADADMEGDVDFVQDLDAEGEGAPEGGARIGFLNEALSFLGIGKVPLSILMMTFLLAFSVTGWGINLALKDVLGTPLLFFPISFAAALFVGLGAASLLASTLGRYLKPLESSAVSSASLAGRIATATITITDCFGQALVKDSYGSLHKVVCRTDKGETIPPGRKLLLIRFRADPSRPTRAGGYYLVEPYDVPKS